MRGNSVKIFIIFFVLYSLVALTTCVVLFALSVYFSPCRPPQPQVYKQVGAQNIAGSWKAGGPASLVRVGAPCAVYRENGLLFLRNERGSVTSASLADQDTIVAHEWQGGLKGYLSDGGKRINWANGTWWIR